MININNVGSLSTEERRAMLQYHEALRNGTQPSQTAAASAEPPRETDVVIINGLRLPPLPQNYGLPWVNNGYEMGDLSNDWQETLDQFDQQNIDITDFTGRPLTESEQAAINKLRQVIDTAKARIDAMPENATLRLSDGKLVTGRELKDLMARLDIQIYDARAFGNNSHLSTDPVSGKVVGGEAVYNMGDPIIRLNIGGLEGYNRNSGGVEYLLLHEVGHMVIASLGNLENIGPGGITAAESAVHERLANDIARALGAFIGMPMLQSPGFGYDPLFPTFSVPADQTPPNYLPPTIPELPTYTPPGTRGPRDVR
jgi:hypothetical protein